MLLSEIPWEARGQPRSARFPKEYGKGTSSTSHATKKNDDAMEEAFPMLTSWRTFVPDLPSNVSRGGWNQRNNSATYCDVLYYRQSSVEIAWRQSPLFGLLKIRWHTRNFRYNISSNKLEKQNMRKKKKGNDKICDQKEKECEKSLSWFISLVIFIIAYSIFLNFPPLLLLRDASQIFSTVYPTYRTSADRTFAWNGSALVILSSIIR